LHELDPNSPNAAPFNLSNLKLTVMLALVVMVLAAFANSVSGSFVWDDSPQIADNPTRAGLHVEDVKRAFTQDFWSNIEPDRARGRLDSIYYRPVFLIALMIGRQIAGAGPSSARTWHLIVIGLHCLNALLVFTAARKIFELTTRHSERSTILMAGLAVAIFAVHPLQSESVAWISGVVGPLSTAFMIGSFDCYLVYRERGRIGWLAGALALFLVGVFTKEQTLVLPLIVLGCELFVFRSKEGPAVSAAGKRMFVGTVAVAVVYLAARYGALGLLLGRNRNLNFPDDAHLGLSNVLQTMPALLAKYCLLLIYPVDLSLMYPFGYVRQLGLTSFWIPLAAMSVVAVLLLWGAGKSKAVAAAALWLILPLAPHLNTTAFVSEEIVHDRYLYGSLIGAGMLVALGLWAIKPPALRIAFTASLIVLLSILTIRQNAQWQSNETLWVRAAQRAPGSRLAHLALGSLAENKRDPATALNEYEIALSINSDSVEALTNSALLCGRSGNWGESRRRFSRVAALTPDNPVAHFNLAFADAVLRRYSEAVDEQQKALELDPNGPRSEEWRERLAQLKKARDDAATKDASQKPALE